MVLTSVAYTPLLLYMYLAAIYGLMLEECNQVTLLNCFLNQP